MTVSADVNKGNEVKKPAFKSLPRPVPAYVFASAPTVVKSIVICTCPVRLCTRLDPLHTVSGSGGKP